MIINCDALVLHGTSLVASYWPLAILPWEVRYNHLYLIIHCIDLLVLESYPLENMSVSFVPSPVGAPQRQRAGSKGTEGCPVRSNDGGWIVRWWLNRPRMPNVKTSHPCCSSPTPIELAHPPSSYNSDFVTVSAFLFLCFCP